MKYIKTKDGIYEDAGTDALGLRCVRYNGKKGALSQDDDKIVKEADTIEELCDVFDVYRKWNGHNCFDQTRAEIPANKAFQYAMEEYNAYKDDGDDIIWFKGAIWTDKGLIYVAKMNDEGELELL